MVALIIQDRLTPAPGQLVAFGFSQGAQMAFEVAFANPAVYRGAIVMSPGTIKHVTLRELTPGPANNKQGVVCTCGAQELPGNVLYTQADADLAKKAGRRVELKLYEGAKGTRLPRRLQRCLSWLGPVRPRRDGREMRTMIDNSGVSSITGPSVR